jgi:RHS repeat-associated protein
VKINGYTPIRCEHDALGLSVSETFGWQLQRRTKYDPDGFLTRRNLTTKASCIYDRAYQYDRRGELAGRSDSRYGAERFLYDPMSRIRQHIDVSGRAHAFVHEPTGDLLTPRGTDRDGNDISAFTWIRTSTYNGVTCIFNAAGNMIERSDERGLLRLDWDANNRLIRSHNPDGTKTEYGYDAQGRRVFKSTNGKKTMFGWDNDAMAIDLNEIGVREFVYFPGSFEPLAMIHNPVLLSTTRDLPAKGTVYHYHNEPNGAACDLTDIDGKVVWSGSYSALGSVDRLMVALIGQPMRLQGQYLDHETKLAYNRHRYYDAATGSFVSEDQLGHAAGDNTYAFDPNVQQWIDPLGLTCRIQGIHEDTVVKGVHIDASNGVELGVRPNHTGGVTFVPIFSGESPSALKAAIREAQEDLTNPKFVQQLRKTADRATSFLGSHESTLARGRSGETRQLSHALGRLLGN